jgi:hypothetical protein
MLLILRREAAMFDEHPNKVAGDLEPTVVFTGSQALVQGVDLSPFGKFLSLVIA